MRKALPPLSPTERAHVLAALNHLRARIGTCKRTARALRARRVTLRRVRAGAGLKKHRSLANRIAKMCGVPVADIYIGRYSPQGACPHCGRGP